MSDLTAPTYLKAQPKNGSVLLTWRVPAYDGGTPVTKYKIYRDTVAGAKTLLTQIAPSTRFADGLNAIANGTTYFYKVQAVNAFGDGPLSAEVSATPSAAIGRPAAPQLLSVIGSTGQIGVAWQTPADNGLPITEYRVARSTAKGAASQPVYVIAYASPFVDTNIVPGVTYFYAVCAVNEAGASPFSNELSAKAGVGTPQSGVPTAPTLLKAQGMNGYVALAWLAPAFDGYSPVKTYRIYRNGAQTGAFEANVLSSNDGTVTNNTPYDYQVSAGNDYGEGPRSAAIKATPSSALTKPGAPTLNALTPGDTQVGLKWTAPAQTGGLPITSYNVYRGTTAGAAVKQALYAKVDGTVTTFVDTNVLNDNAYFYVVCAVNEMGGGAFSNEMSATPKASAPPPKPLPPGQAILIGADTEAVATLSWKPPDVDGGSPVTGYNIYRSTASGQETLLASVGLVTSYTDRAVVMGAVYFYKVAAVNAVGEAPLSNEVHT